ncbi:MAG TPA: methylated-DNA--[protein]-cysteine S-methyltransferase [Balneolaceae bacterium]|nr:methylated-DNA--[protein]-cysteine S-methyltransferase [Balneolaceae bacterium]
MHNQPNLFKSALNRQADLPPEQEMFKAFIDRNIAYEGIFVAGVKTTGIFCRPTCSARKPKIANVAFFPDAKQALDAGFRPCKRCKPLQPEGKTPGRIKEILSKVEGHLNQKWSDADVEKAGADAARLRKWFKKHHRITFQTYLKLRRLGSALGQIQNGKQTSGKNFSKEAMENLLNKSIDESEDSIPVYLNRIATPLGFMLAGATDSGLCLLEFMDRRMLKTQLQIIRKRLNAAFKPGSNSIIQKTAHEMERYFDGSLKEFTIPLTLTGTDFQQKVWNQLQAIPYARACSYKEQAQRMGNQKAVRAVAGANGKNKIAIIIPCHRVIGSDGSLTGYGGGLWRKKYLLNLERSNLR